MAIGTQLFEVLKKDTSVLHGQIEKDISPLSRFVTPAAYLDFLMVTLGFYRGAEAYLEQQPWDSLGIDFEQRRKVHLLEEDIAALGGSWKGLRIGLYNPPDHGLPCAMGCMYVLEGATLGGQHISRHLSSIDIQPGRGGTFYAGYGPETGRMWTDFKIKCSATAMTDLDLQMAVAGAVYTFEAMADWIRQMESTG